MTLRPFFLLLFLSCALGGRAQIDTSKFHLRNAWETAQWLHEVSNNRVVLDETMRLKLLGSLFWYANLDEDSMTNSNLSQALKDYPGLEKVAQSLMLPTSSLTKMFFDSDLTEIDRAFREAYTDKQLKDLLRPTWEQYHNTKDLLQEDENALNRARRSSKTKSEQLGRVNAKSASITPTENSATTAEDTVQDSSLQLRNDIADLETQISALEKSKEKLGDSLEKIREKVLALFHQDVFKSADFLCKLYPTKCGVVNRDIMPLGRDASSQQFASEIHATQQILIQTEMTAAGDFRMPSQSELIDALAIYLARRMKQEAVMWFFETISKDASRYDLVNTFFPATMTLLKTYETHEIPNMGAQWQYALSKDFLKLPRNLTTSRWLTQRWPQATLYRDHLTGFCDLADGLVQRRSFREVVRTLYLDAPRKTRSDTTVDFRDFITLLHTVNTELFYPDTTGGFRLLRYEDFAGASREQLELTMGLLDLKYGGTVSRVLNIENKAFRLPGGDTTEILRRMLGGVEGAITRIETVRRDFLTMQAKMEDKPGEKDWFYSGYSLWSSVNDLLAVFAENGPSAPILSQRLAHSRRAFHYAGQLFEIYNLITKKNFAGAVQNSIALVDTMLYAPGGDSLLRMPLAKNLDSLVEAYHGSSYLRDLLRASLPEVVLRETAPGRFAVVTFKVPALLSALEAFDAGRLTKDTTLRFSQVLKIQPPGRADSSVRGEVLFTRTAKSADVRVVVGEDSVLVGDAITTLDNLHKSLARFADMSAVYGLAYDSSNTFLTFKKSSPVAALFFDNDRHAVKTIRRLSGFLNDAALAQNDKQLSRVVESYAMPTGSYKRKRNVRQSVDLTAFAGIYVGYETTAVKDTGGVKANSWVYGFSAPIGLSYSHTFSKRIDKGYRRQRGDRLPVEDILNPDRVVLRRNGLAERTAWTVSTTLSIVDLGAVVSYRMGHAADSVLLHDVRWEQLVSPGLHLSIGIPTTPLVLNLGAQHTPALRRFSTEEDRQFNAWRFYGGIFFDLPLFNFWERRSYRHSVR